jgi:quercetin dioxygenase-like cupin family protein
MKTPEAKDLVTQRKELPEQSGAWGTLRWLCNGELQPGAQQTLGICHIFPGKSNPLHYHPNCEEVLHVLAGRGRHSVDGEWVELRPGTTIRVPVGVKHNLINESAETMVCVIAFSSPDRQTVFLE